MSLTVIPLKAVRQNGNFVLFDEITTALSKNKISLKFYLKYLTSFCKKNKIKIIDMIKNKKIRREIFNNKRVSPSIFLLYIILSYILKNEYFIKKIKI